MDSVTVSGISGESQAEKTEGRMDALSFVWSMSHGNDGIPGTSSDHSVGHPKFDTFRVNRNLDASSPLLMLACASGRKIESVEYESKKDTETALVVYCMKGVRVRSIKHRYSRPEDCTPDHEATSKVIEEVEFRYAELSITVTKVGGDNTTSTGWNRVKNQKV